MVPSISRESFVENLRRSGLVDEVALERSLEQIPATERGKVVARALVKQGLLTRFQAELILGGRTFGFFLGQYRIVDQLGQGGMSKVYKAVHERMHRAVALKLLAPQLVKTPKARQLFDREVRAAGRLTHPNIVTAYDAGHIADRHFLVMEWVDGPNVEQFVRKHGPLPVGLACEIIRQAGLGLAYAHELEMVHRDIKPSNLLIQRVGKSATPLVKILDFGLARLHEHRAGDADATLVTKNNTVMGTPDYLSPEQARTVEVDIRSDLYSLGCTFYFLLTGRVPFPGGSAHNKMQRHATAEPAPIEQDLPAPVLAILRRLMAKNPEDRFQTPEQLIAAVTPFAVPVVPFWKRAWENPPADETGTEDSGESDAMTATLLPDMSPTPLARDPQPVKESDEVAAGSWWWVLGLSIALIGALSGVLAMLMQTE
jgi:serine/threonine protein kinase